MRSSIVYALLAALITLFFMYLDTRLLDNPKTKTTYVKNMLFVAGLIYFGIVLIGESKFDQILGLSGQVGRSSRFANGINQEILTGLPNF